MSGRTPMPSRSGPLLQSHSERTYAFVNVGVNVLFECDDQWTASSFAKHEASFELAREVWNDPFYVGLPERVEDGERRWHAIGMIGAVVVLVVVHSHPEPHDEHLVRIIRPERPPHTKGIAMSKKALSPKLQNQLNRLAALPDDRINTDDIPEVTTEAWQFAQRPTLYRPIKKPVTLRLDADIVTWFKEHAHDHGYQTEINRVLRRYVSESEARGLGCPAGPVL